MKPFNLETALNGAPVCMASGDAVRDLHLFRRSIDSHRLYGVVYHGRVCNWTAEGVFGEYPEEYVDMNLVMVDDDQL